MPKLAPQFIESPVQLTQEFLSMEDFAKTFLNHFSFHTKPECLQKDQKLLQNIILPALGQMTVQDVLQSHIEALHAKLREMPYQANRVLALLSKMFSLAISWNWREDNPAIAIERYQEEKRDRGLNQEEQGRLWAVLENYPSHLTAYVFKFLLLTGARKEEVLSSTWDQFDLEKGIWTKPSHLTKQKEAEPFLLSEKALDVLHNLKRLNTQNSKSLFSVGPDGAHIKNIKPFWKKVLKEANLEHKHMYDLRHVYAHLNSNR